MFHAASPHHLLLAIALWVVAGLAGGCAIEAQDPETETDADADVAVDPDAGGVDTTPSSPGTSYPDRPGRCLEVFGPEGISHSPPRLHDAGPIAVGERTGWEVTMYNFCGAEIAFGPLTVVEETDGAGLDVETSLAHRRFSGQGGPDLEALVFAVEPSQAGEHRVTLRQDSTDGHYELSVVFEAVEPMP